MSCFASLLSMTWRSPVLDRRSVLGEKHSETESLKNIEGNSGKRYFDYQCQSFYRAIGSHGQLRFTEMLMPPLV